MRPPALFAILISITLSSCVSSGNLQIQGDLSTLGLPATFSYSSKNPISSK
jgi:hypothetical protein